MESLQQLSPSDPEAIYRAFNEVVSDLTAKIAHLQPNNKAAQDSLLEHLSGLNAWAIDTGPSLPPRDQEIYSRQVSSLQAQLRQVTNANRPKFRFKSRSVAVTHDSGSTSPSSSATIPSSLYRSKDPRRLYFSQPGTINSDSDGQPTNQPSAPTSVSPAAVAHGDYRVIANELGKSLDLPSGAGRPVTLNGLQSCVVRNWCGKKIPALYVSKIRNCVIDCGWVEGSVFIEDVADSIMFVRARQVRVHVSKSLVIVMDVRTQPIVEDCENLKVVELEREWLENEYGPDPGTNMWRHVQDFKWHKAEPSPHWTAASHKLSKEDLARFLRKDTPRLEILDALSPDIQAIITAPSLHT